MDYICNCTQHLLGINNIYIYIYIYSSNLVSEYIPTGKWNIYWQRQWQKHETPWKHNKAGMADDDFMYTVVFTSEFNTNLTNSLDSLFYLKKCTILY